MPFRLGPGKGPARRRRLSSLPAVDVPTPFTQTDWPLPIVRSVIRQFTIAGRKSLDTFFGGPDQPPPQRDWPNPRGPQRANALLTWLDPLKLNLRGQDKFFGAPGMGPDYDWPNPPVRARSNHALTWLQSLNQVTQMTAAVFRGPTVFRMWRPSAMAAVTAFCGVSLLLTTLAPALAAPFDQIDWPNPIRAESARELRTFLNPVRLELIGQDQFFAAAGMGPDYDWPNPRAAASAIELRTWLLNLQQSTLQAAAAPSPFFQLEWPTPGARPFLRQSFSSGRKGADQFFGDPGQPVPNLDWPNPWAPRRATELLTWLFNLSQTTLAPSVAPPFFLTDWPIPRGQRPGSIDLRTLTNTLWPNLLGQDQFFGGPGQAPANLHWPVPRGPVGGIDLRTWLQDLLQSTLSTILPSPFYQLDWPNPRGPIPALGLKTWADVLKLALLGQDRFFAGPGQAPANLDWPVPKGAARAQELRTWLLNLQQSTLQLTPFAQTGWPVPRGYLQPIVLRTWTDPLKLELLGKDFLPFFQTAWPNPRGPLYAIDLRNWFANPLSCRVLVPFGPSRILIVPGIATAFLVPNMGADFIVLSELADFIVPPPDEET